MPSSYGRRRGMVCAGCGIGYDKLRTGMTWTEVRNLIIAMKDDPVTGKTKYGRRGGVLGFHHELKMQMWEQHVGLCTDDSPAAREQLSAENSAAGW